MARTSYSCKWKVTVPRRTQINLHPEITHVKMLVQASIGLISLLQLSGAAFALPAEQERLGTRPPKDAQTVRAELKKAEIIPTGDHSRRW
jgi:hypothetical protein